MPRIVYLTLGDGAIYGGVKVAFQHVQMLNAGGIEAVAATPGGTRPTWFATQAPVVPLDALRADDVLVIAENSHAQLAYFARSPHRKVVFCQNPFYMVDGLGGAASYAGYGVHDVICPGRTMMQIVQQRMPGMRVSYAPYLIDPDVFAPAPKKLQIACVPRKRQREYMVIRDQFQALHPQFGSVPWCVIDGMHEAQVAQAMGESTVFLSLARLEGHCMTTLEAMASGCIVAGFKGTVGAHDCADEHNGLWAAEDDVFGCVERLAHAVQLAGRHDEDCRAMVAAGRQTALGYGREESAALVLAFWRRLLAS